MAIRLYAACLGFLLLLPLLSPAYARQPEEVVCRTLPEAVENLKTPTLANIFLWDTLYGAPLTDERFTAIHPVDGDKLLTAGTRTTAEGVSTPFLILFDRLNRPEWNWREQRDIRIHDIFMDDQGRYIAAGALKAAPEQVWIGIFNEQGDKIKEHTIGYTPDDFHYGDMIEGAGEARWVLTGQIDPERNTAPANAQMIGMNKNFSTLWSRGFVPGADNKINALAAGMQGSQPFYIGAGSIKTAREEAQALAIRFDQQGNIEWQQQFNRAAGASLHSAAVGDRSQIFVGGTVSPRNSETPGGGWLAALDSANGAVAWERYYARPETGYNLADIEALPDGRLALGLTGTARPGREALSHARLITLSPRGVMLDDQSHTAGTGVGFNDLETGADGRRYLGGHARITSAAPDNPTDGTVVSDQGWAIALPPLETYQDPCAAVGAP